MQHTSIPDPTSLRALGIPETCQLMRDPEVGVDERRKRLQLVISIDIREAPRGHLESVEQRLRLLKECQGLVVESADWQGDLLSDTEYELRFPYFDGESLPLYLERMKRDDHVNGFRVLIDVIHRLICLAMQPRLFSNVADSDFSLTSIDGTVGVGLVPLSAILNVESTKSDRQIAQLWLGYLVELVEKVLPKRRFGESGKEIVSVCRQQLEEIRAGRASELADWFRAVLDSVESQQGKWRDRSLGTELKFPPASRGILGEFLWNAYSESEGEASSNWLSPETPYSALMQKQESGEKRIRILLPDSWTQESMLDPVNRKMAHSFLKQHHNGFRTLSISCGEGYTALVGTAEKQFSLSMLLALKSNFTFDEVYLFLRTIHRAIEQFESADLQVELNSLHQVFVSFEDEMGMPNSEILRENLTDWPAWDVKIRVEPPIETFVDQSGWRTLFEKMGRKFFPSFVCWALDYSRFQWAWRTGRLETEPSSWDVDLEALLTMAARHLAEQDPVQRRKFLELLEEWDSAQVPHQAVS